MKKYNIYLFIVIFLCIMEITIILCNIDDSNKVIETISTNYNNKEVKINEIIDYVNLNEMGEIKKITNDNLGYLVEIEKVIMSQDISQFINEKYNNEKIFDYKFIMKNKEIICNITILFPKFISSIA
ncbi:MAG: hypothetical protein GX275_00240 [Clostridiales bacterium]|nr:hypothetical protein [Clostridiales bacterium]